MERQSTIDRSKLPIPLPLRCRGETMRQTPEHLSNTEKIIPLIEEAALNYVDFISMGQKLTPQERLRLTSSAMGNLIELDNIRNSPRRSGVNLINFRNLHGTVTANWFEEMYHDITEMTQEKQELANVNAYFGIVDLFARETAKNASRKNLKSERSVLHGSSTEEDFVTAVGLEQVYFALKNPSKIVNPDADSKFQITAMEQARLEYGDRLAEYRSILYDLEPEIRDIEERSIKELRFSSSAERREIGKNIQHTIKGLRDDQQVRVLTLQGLPEEKAGELKKRLLESGKNFAKIVVAIESLGYAGAAAGAAAPFLGNITQGSAEAFLGLSYGLYYAIMGLVGLQNARMSEYDISSLNPATQASVESMKQSPYTTKWMRYMAGIISNYGSEGLLDFMWAGFAAANPTSTFNGNSVGVLGGIAQAVYAESKIREKKRKLKQQEPQLSELEKDVL